MMQEFWSTYTMVSKYPVAFDGAYVWDTLRQLKIKSTVKSSEFGLQGL